MKYKVKSTPELQSRFSFLYHIGFVKIDRMISDDIARVFDIDDGIYFDIETEYLIPVKG